jgi:DNA-directed RNA polymerase subunit RPC12/RpoP
MAKGVLKWLLSSISAILIVVGVLFIIASYAETIRFAEGLVFIAVALFIAYFARERKDIEIKQEVRITASAKVKELRCPNCSALLDAQKTQIVYGKPYITCDYCSNKFEVTEEPTW